MGKKTVYCIFVIAIILISFFIGFHIKQPQKYDSCKSAYDNLKESELCKGKSWDYIGTDYVVNNSESFDYIWDEYETKYYANSIEKDCYLQAETKFIKTGKRENLISCSANQIEIINSTLRIQCACFFG